MENHHPQGLVLGTIFFNVFIHDIFYFNKRARFTNYADDNTLSFEHPNIWIVRTCLEAEPANAIWWFSINLIQANPEKFPLIFFNCKVESPLILDGSIIQPEKEVKLLGIIIDENFRYTLSQKKFVRKPADSWALWEGLFTLTAIALANAQRISKMLYIRLFKHLIYL